MPRPQKRLWYPKHHRFLMVEAKCIHHMSMSPEEKAVEDVLAKHLGIHSNLISIKRWRTLREDLAALLKPKPRLAAKAVKGRARRTSGRRSAR